MIIIAVGVATRPAGRHPVRRSTPAAASDWSVLSRIRMPAANSPRCASPNGWRRSAPAPRSGRSPTPYGNALAETTNGLYKTECVYGPDSTATTSYNPDSTVNTQTNPLTSTTLTYNYDAMARVASIDYTGGTTRTFGYDALGQLTSDTLTTGASTLRAATYSYDPAGNRTASTLAPAGLPGAGNTSYTYDKATGSPPTPTRPTPPPTTATTRPTTAPPSAPPPPPTTPATGSPPTAPQLHLHPRGTLDTTTIGTTTTTSTFDAFDRLITDGTATYSYDALDRLATAGGNAFQYDATNKEAVTDGSQTFARDTPATPSESKPAAAAAKSSPIPTPTSSPPSPRSTTLTAPPATTR